MATWVEEFTEECAVFPNRPHDDQVDGDHPGAVTVYEASPGQLLTPHQFVAGRREWAY